MKRVLSTISAILILTICCSSIFVANATEPTPIDAGTITLSATSFTYDGTAIEPEVSLTVGGATVSSDYYDVVFTNNINAGTATVTLTGKDLFSGTISTNFTIKPLSISSSSIAKSVGKVVVNTKPVITAKLGPKTLVEGVDYTVSCQSIDKAGIQAGKVIITGKGNFKSSKTYIRNVYPAKVQGLKVSAITTTSLSLSWNSQESAGVTGYKVYTSDADGSNESLVATVTKNSAKITKLSEGKYYYIKVKSYKNCDEKNLNGDYSAIIKTCTTPKTAVINNVGITKDKKAIVAKWSKVPCSGYEVWYSTDAKFKKNVNKKIFNSSSKTSIKFNANTKKVYYVKVRAFRKYNGTTVYGKWSSKLGSKFNNLYSTYTSRYVNNKDRTTNLRIASKAINGTILQPGETFNFNNVVGKRTEAKGYKSAHVFAGSNEVVMGTGGGVCQVASTMFNATLLGNLQIVERHQHSQRVSYVPLGRDAAIYWGSENYRFKNNTKYAIKIKMTVKDGKITCSMYTSEAVKPKKVKLSVSRKGNNFTLRRSVGGKVNYTTKSNY